MQLRPVVPEADYGRIAELVSAVETMPLTREHLLNELRSAPAGQVERVMVAVGDDGVIAGFSRVFRLPWWSEGRFSVPVVVDPALRGRGTGSLLYADATAWALGEGATRLETAVPDGDPPSLRFAEARGFAIDRHLFTSSLDVAGFDPAPYAGVAERVKASGIRLFTLAEADDTPENRRRMYEVHRDTALDIPGRERRFSEFAQYQVRHQSGDSFRPELLLFAADGDRWVGMAALAPMGDQVLINGMTGVVEGYRGRQIALALKLLAIETARRHGFARLLTNNDSKNEPMLAINRKLGYRPEPGLYLMAKLAPAGESHG